MKRYFCFAILIILASELLYGQNHMIKKLHSLNMPTIPSYTNPTIPNYSTPNSKNPLDMYEQDRRSIERRDKEVKRILQESIVR